MCGTFEWATQIWMIIICKFSNLKYLYPFVPIFQRILSESLDAIMVFCSSHLMLHHQNKLVLIAAHTNCRYNLIFSHFLWILSLFPSITMMVRWKLGSLATSLSEDVKLWTYLRRVSNHFQWRAFQSSLHCWTHVCSCMIRCQPFP